MRAFCLIREKPWYRREAFASGLKAVGFDVLLRGPESVKPDDVLVVWNRYMGTHEIALRFEKDGGRVWVAENGYINADLSSPKFSVHPQGPKPGDYYALAQGYHNGGGTWPTGGAERWDALGITPKPWRTSGNHILVCPNRSFGIPGRMMHPDWAEKAQKRIQRITSRPVRVRGHPGNDAPKRALSEDLKDCWAVVIWSSSCGVHALVEGIPVFCESPYWIMKGAGATGSPDEPVTVERLPHFQRMAWAQWTCEEIARGEPFNHLLSHPR